MDMPSPSLVALTLGAAALSAFSALFGTRLAADQAREATRMEAEAAAERDLFEDKRDSYTAFLAAAERFSVASVITFGGELDPAVVERLTAAQTDLLAAYASVRVLGSDDAVMGARSVHDAVTEYSYYATTGFVTEDALNEAAAELATAIETFESIVRAELNTTALPPPTIEPTSTTVRAQGVCDLLTPEEIEAVFDRTVEEGEPGEPLNPGDPPGDCTYAGDDPDAQISVFFGETPRDIYIAYEGDPDAREVPDLGDGAFLTSVGIEGGIGGIDIQSGKFAVGVTAAPPATERQLLELAEIMLARVEANP